MKLILAIIMVFVSSLFSEIIAQQNRFVCRNLKEVEYDIKALRFGHFHNIELKKGSDRNKSLVSHYKAQALEFQKKRDAEFDRCMSLPECTEDISSPNFYTEEECMQYIRSLESAKVDIEKKISGLRRTIGDLHREHRYTDAMPYMKQRNIKYGELACIEKNIEACNCGNVSSGNAMDEYHYSDNSFNAGFDISGEGWGIKNFHNLGQDAAVTISGIIENGYTPSGLSVNGYTNQIMFIEGDILGISNWSIEYYSDVYSLQNGISNYMEQGYVPMGISFTNDGQLYVLYILSQLRATAWQLVESEMDLNVVTQNVQPYIYEKYIPVGITVFDGLYYTLLVNLPESEPAKWTVEGYENNNYILQQSANNLVNNGFIPFGYLQEQGVVNMLYIGF